MSTFKLSLDRVKNKSQKIPKVMNFFWSGETLSWMRYMTLYSFRKLNPDWEIVLHVFPYSRQKEKPWPDKNCQDFFNFPSSDYLSKVPELGVRISQIPLNKKYSKLDPVRLSDVFRWYLLYTNGGFYSDMDILYVKPMESFYNRISKYATVLAYTTKPTHYFSIGFIGSTQGNPFFRDVYKIATNRLNRKGCYQTAGSVAIYELIGKAKNWNEIVPHTNQLELYYQKYGTDIYWDFQRIVYPYSYRQIPEIFFNPKSTLPEESIGLHWFAGAEMTQEFNRNLSKNNYFEYNNLFCNLVKRVLGE